MKQRYLIFSENLFPIEMITTHPVEHGMWYIMVPTRMEAAEKYMLLYYPSGR